MSYPHNWTECHEYHDLVRDFGTAPPEIVCLCGSTRFMDAFMVANEELTLAGKIVVTVAVVKHGAADHWGESQGEDVAAKLDELHKRKIDLADWVYVLNVDGYIGDSTRSEIEYAEKLGKPIRYLTGGDHA